MENEDIEVKEPVIVKTKKTNPSVFKQFMQLFTDMFNFSTYESKNAGKKSFNLPKSFAKMMRIGDYDSEEQLFYLTDGRTPIAMYEIKGMNTEGCTEKDFKNYEQKIFQLLSIFPRLQKKDQPWTVSMYARDEHDISYVVDDFENNINPRIKDRPESKLLIHLLRRQCRYMTRKGGMIVDPKTGNEYGGTRRVTRLVFYRQNPKVSKDKLLREMNNLRLKLEQQLTILKPFGTTYHRIDEKRYFHWLFDKFHLTIKDFERPSDYLINHPYVSEDDRAYGYDIIEQALASPIRSNDKEGTWQVGNTHHKYISAMGLSKAPEIGAVSAERDISNTYQAWMDSLPDGCEFHMTFNPVSEYDLKNDMKRQKKAASKSLEVDAEQTLIEIDYFEREIVAKNYLYPTQIGCFIVAESEENLQMNANIIEASLGGLSLEILPEDYDIEQLDKWFRFLPGNYQMHFDSEYNTAKLTSVRHLARLAPIGYGRMTGGKLPLYLYFNRNGQPIYNNPILEKVNSAHAMTLGATGSGKSVIFAMKMVFTVAVLGMYLVVMDAGESYKLIIEFFKLMGLKVKTTVIKHTNKIPEVTLNPFIDTVACFEQYQEMQAVAKKVEEDIESMFALRGCPKRGIPF